MKLIKPKLILLIIVMFSLLLSSCGTSITTEVYVENPCVHSDFWVKVDKIGKDVNSCGFDEMISHNLGFNNCETKFDVYWDPGTTTVSYYRVKIEVWKKDGLDLNNPPDYTGSVLLQGQADKLFGNPSADWSIPTRLCKYGFY